MKKVISLLLSFVMLIGTIACVDLSAYASTVASISYTPVKPIEFVESSGGVWVTNDNIKYYYYYYIPQFKQGDILTVTDNDGNSVNYTFGHNDNGNACFISESGEEISTDSLRTSSKQEFEHWTLGSDNYYTIAYMGASTRVAVTIVESPIASVSFTPLNPIEIIENNGGNWDTNNNGEYYHYSIPWFRQGDVLTVTDKDGNSVDYTYDNYEDRFISESGDVLYSLRIYSDQYSKPWTLGSDNYYTIEYMGATTQVPVTIVENPVASISYTPVNPIEFVENCGGNWSTNDNGEYYAYSIPWFSESDILTITDKDGNSVNYSFKYDEGCFLSESGDAISPYDLRRYSDQFSKPWTLGSDNYYTIEYMGATTQVNVSIVRCEHKYLAEIHQPTCINDGYTHYYCENCGNSYDTDYITATGVHTYENGFCKYCHTRDENYTFPTISAGETKTVNIENGGDRYYFTFTPQSSGNYVFSSDSNRDTYGYLYDSDMNEITSDDDSGANFNFSISYNFEAGITYIFGCKYLSSSDTGSFDVSLIENPVASISYTPIKPKELFENVGGYWDTNDNGEYYHYDTPWFNQGDVLTVTDKDGNSVDYTFDYYEDCFISESGDVISSNSLRRNSDQYSKPWTLGSDNYYTIEYMGATTQVPVTIVENPVASISYTPVNPIEFVENCGGNWSTNDNGEYYAYSIPWFSESDILTITDKDGNSVNYSFKYDEGCFLSESGDAISPYDLRRYSDQFSKPWTLGSDNYYTIEYMGATTQVNVSIVRCEHKYLAEIHQPTCINDGYTHYYCENCGNSYDTDYITATGVHTYENGFCKYCHTRDENYTFPTISAGETKTVNIENGGDRYYFTFTPQSSGNYVFSSDSNRDTYGYLYDSDMNEITSDDDSGTNTNFSIRYDFEAGTTYIFGCKYLSSSDTGSFDVSLIENRMAGISYTPANPIEIVENTNGEIYEDGDADIRFYYYYIPQFNRGDILTITDKDGNSVDYTFDYYEDYDEDCFISENGDVISQNSLRRNSDQHSNHWTLGSDNYYTIEYMGATTQVAVTIVESPVASVSYTPIKPIEIIENTRGYSCKNGWHYYAPEFNEGDVIVVTFKDGTQDSFVYTDWRFLNSNGIRLDVDNYDFEYSGLGEAEFKIDLYDYGFSTYVPVTIVENPVASIEYNCIEGFNSVEGITYVDPNGEESTFRDGYIKNGDTLTVNYKNGTVEEYEAVLDNNGFYHFVTADGNELNANADFRIKNNYDDEYRNVVSVDIICYGYKLNFPIVSNIYISSLTFEPANPVTIIESNGREEDRNTWINDEGNVYYSTHVYWTQDENGEDLIKSEIFNIGDVINVTFSDGRTARYTYKANRSYEYGYGFIGDDNTVLFVGNITSNQNENPWTVDGDNYFIINYSQASTDRIPVTIVPSGEHIHSYNAVVTEPTSNTRGYTTYTCECGDSYVDNYTDYASDNSVLLAVLEQIESYSNDDFSASTLESLRNIYDSYSSMASDSYSQSDIDKAVSDLLTAISALEPYLNLDITAPNGTFTVAYDGKTNSNNSNSTLFGTNVTVSATANEGYRFVGWYDTVNNLYFSKNAEYSFKITTNTSLTAVFVEEQSATLTFTTYSNWVQSTVTKTIDEWNALESIDGLLPVVPYRYGYSNGRWVYDNTEVLAKLQAGENVSLIPEYDKDDTSLPTPPSPDGDTPVLDLYYNFDTGANVGSFVMAAGIPENCQIESVGIAFYYKDAKEFDPTKFELLINNKMLTGRFNTDEIDDIYIINLNNMTARYNFAARGYVTYYNADGILKTVYSNQVNIVNREQV